MTALDEWINKNRKGQGPKSRGFAVRSPWIRVPNFTAIHSVVVEKFQFKPEIVALEEKSGDQIHWQPLRTMTASKNLQANPSNG